MRLINNRTADGTNRWVELNEETNVATFNSVVFMAVPGKFKRAARSGEDEKDLVEHDITHMRCQIIAEAVAFTDEKDLRQKAAALVKAR